MARVDYFDDPAAPAANSLVPSVTAAVRNDSGALLLVRKVDNGLWALPGGGMDLGESLTEAVVREVKEETGLDVAVDELVGTYTDPRHVMAYDDGEVRQEFSVCFRATLVGGELTTSDETSEVRFVNVDELENLEIHPSMRLRITHALRPGHPPFLG